MRVEGPDRPKAPASTAKAKRAARKQSTASAVQVTDAIALREKAKALLQSSSEARIEKIVALRDAIERGEYDVAPQEVAKKIVLYALAEGFEQ